MNAIVHIRKTVLGLSQVAVAELTGVTQATVSRWEKGELSPNLRELGILREAAKSKGAEWDDSWFFDPPRVPAAGDGGAQGGFSRGRIGPPVEVPHDTPCPDPVGLRDPNSSEAA